MSSTFHGVFHAASRLCAGPLPLVLALLATAPSELFAQPPAQGDWTVPDRRARRVNPVLTMPDAIEMGRLVYQKECATCHGKTGRGDGMKAGDLRTRPSDLTSERVQNQRDGALFWKITEGRGDMPNTRTTLTDEQRWTVVIYLRALSPTKP